MTTLEDVEILLVEDNPGDARLIRALFDEITTAQYDLMVAPTIREFKVRLAAAHFDVIVSDLTLPDSLGLETFRKLFQLPL